MHGNGKCNYGNKRDAYLQQLIERKDKGVIKVGFQSERQKADYLKNIFANVYLKDVIEKNKIQSVDEIGILVDILASEIGAPTNPSKLANTFASERQMTYANKTISNHIDHLTDAFLISKASRYDIKGRRYIVENKDTKKNTRELVSKLKRVF